MSVKHVDSATFSKKVIMVIKEQITTKNNNTFEE